MPELKMKKGKPADTTAKAPKVGDLGELKQLAKKAKQTAAKAKSALKSAKARERAFAKDQGGWYCCCGEPKCRCGIGPFHWRGDSKPPEEDKGKFKTEPGTWKK
jgi:hypothetical protein